MGLDVPRFLDRTALMVRSCGPASPPAVNPGVQLGLIIGAAARLGRDKLTIIASPGIAALGAWLEQLVAESTGKNGKAVIPVDREPIGSPALYGRDRVFVHLRLPEADGVQEAAVAALEAAGHPVVRIDLAGPETIGQEFFRWEIATAVAGAILGVHPFDQPDVEAAKVEARRLTDAFESSGVLPEQSPTAVIDGVGLYSDRAGVSLIGAGREGRPRSLAEALRAHFGRIGEGDYVAVLAFIAMSEQAQASLERIRTHVRDARRVATCVGFGPRFLHSTGQAYKGGPNSGVFLQITCDDREDLPVPGRRLTFGVVKAAQARGDFDVLASRGRRILRVHLGADVEAGLAALEQAVREALPLP
jgi:transaldolase/glucose-6-phosphate isomerase